ncbi:phage portal protein [Methylobacterium haplocladii]|nr:phage portal protein [Methylobacterium haplocladii]
MAGSFSGQWSMFSPGVPLAPITPAQPVRRIDFPVGHNTVTTPRSYEPFGFAQLRSFANVELVRLAIETRKDQIERLDWQIRPRKMLGRARQHDRDTRIDAVEKMLRKPDGVTPFATWMRMLVEDLLVLDAPAIERRRNRGGELIGLDVVDGGTIKVLVDERGRRPMMPLPAYQQVIKGVPWADLTSDDLIYAPRNPRSNHLYGYSPVEQIVVTLTTAMRRQATQLAYFTEGNTPAGLLSAPEGWTPEQIKDWQSWMDAKLSGQTGERSKQLWVPKDTKYQAFKDAPIKDEFDEWLARIVCFAFSLPPTPFVKQVNRATSDNDAEQSEEQGLAPLLLWAKRMLDSVVQDDLGHPDLEFEWNPAREIDPKVQAEIDDKNLRNGSETIDEVRERRGQGPVPGGNKARIYIAQGAIEIEANDAAVIASAEAAARAAQPPEVDSGNGDDEDPDIDPPEGDEDA